MLINTLFVWLCLHDNGQEYRYLLVFLYMTDRMMSLCTQVIL